MTTQTATSEGPARPNVDYHLGELADVLFQQVGFEPTGEEQARILRTRKRFKVVSGGDQSGKSIEAGADWLLHWFEDTVKFPGESLLYWLVAIDYDRTRAEFNYIKQNLEALGMPVNASKRVDPGFIEVKFPDEARPRLRVETKSSKDPRTLAMFAPHGIIVCEASQIDLETYWKCLSRVAPKKGWLHMSGTLEGSLGWYPGILAAWAHGNGEEQSFRLPSPTNWHLYPGGENDPEIIRLKNNSSDAFFMERIMGIASPPKGLVFTEFRPDVHIRDIPYNPDLPLHIWEDPGYGHAHAILLAQKLPGGMVNVFHEMYEQGIITEDMIDALMGLPYWKNPNKKLVIDPNYAKQHAATHSVSEIWLAKTGLAAFGTKCRISEGTERIKSFLKINPLTNEPGAVFNPQCKGILSEFGAYPNPFDGQTKVYSWKMDREGNVIGDEPDDKNNDGIKAFSYGLVEEFGLVTTPGSGLFLMQRHGGRPERERSVAFAMNRRR